MNKFYLLLICGLFVTFSSCKTGKKALEQGQYDLAVTQAVNRLKSNGDSKKARATLKHAYKLAVSTHLDNATRASASADMFKWERMAVEYLSINRLYDAIRKCPSCLALVPNPVNYDSELASARNKAADTRYTLGMAAMQQKSIRQKALEAHQHFETVKDMVPQFKEVDDKLEESLYYATLKVVVEPIPSPTRLLEVRHEFFVNKINEYLHHQRINKYVRFYTPQEAKNQNLEYVDHVIKMEFDRFSLGNVYQNNTEKELSRDSVVIATNDGVDVYGTVKATLKTSEKSITGSGVLDFKILDNDTGKVITQEKMSSQYIWRISWASYNGDKKALSAEELEMVAQSNVTIPSPQFMFEEFTAPLYNQVISKVSSYYNNY
jgi:tetratricopeptide (TPR) repeat protein